MKLILYVIVWLLAFTYPQRAVADTRNQVQLWGQVLPQSTLRNVGTTQATALAGEAYVGERFFLDDQGASLLILGARARHTTMDTSQPLVGVGAQQFTVLQPEVTWLHSLSDDWTLVASARPGFFGRLGEWTDRSFRLEGAVFADYVAGPWTIGFGVARGSNFGRVLIVPLLHLLYLSEDNWMLDVLAPVRAEFWWLPAKRWELGATITLLGAQYGVEAIGVDTVELADLLVGPAFRLQLGEKGYFSVEAGGAVVRRYRALLGDALVTDYNPPVQFYARLGYQWRY